RGGGADELQYQVSDSVRLVELQEVSGTVDDAHVAVVGKGVGYPTGESRCHATVVASVKVQARQLRPRHPVPVQVAVWRRRAGVADRGPVGPERSAPALRCADRGVDVTQICPGV